MAFIKHKISNFLNHEKLCYLMAGMWNTVFGYFIGVSMYLLLNPYLHLIFIAIFSNLIAITMAFVTYKVFVFRTSGNWILEYLRCYIVYGLNAILGIFCLWLLVSQFGLNIWYAQGISIFITVVISYIMHRRYTFQSTSG